MILVALGLWLQLASGECSRHIHANQIRSQISQVENDGVKREVCTIVGLQYLTRLNPRAMRIHTQIHRLYRRSLSREVRTLTISSQNSHTNKNTVKLLWLYFSLQRTVFSEIKSTGFELQHRLLILHCFKMPVRESFKSFHYLNSLR